MLCGNQADSPGRPPPAWPRPSGCRPGRGSTGSTGWTRPARRRRPAKAPAAAGDRRKAWPPPASFHGRAWLWAGRGPPGRGNWGAPCPGNVAKRPGPRKETCGGPSCEGASMPCPRTRPGRCQTQPVGRVTPCASSDDGRPIGRFMTPAAGRGLPAPPSAPRQIFRPQKSFFRPGSLDIFN